MQYGIEVYDRRGLRVARFDRVPLMEASRTAPDAPDVIEGLLPEGIAELGPGYRISVRIEGEPFCEATVTWVGPQWSDTRKLILDRYVPFHEVIAFRAEQCDTDRNTRVCRGYSHGRIDAMVKDVINAAQGAIHYLVDHVSYPDGAVREFAKYTARKTPATELETGGIGAGQWVETPRIDASAAYASDGDTIAGLVVDGIPWPELRLMMLDCEELSKNSHAVKRHPEVSGWSAERYAASGYALAAEASRQALQALIDRKGIEAIELNPHRGYDGAYDDRVDTYGSYIGLVYGGGECLNAAMAELGRADVYLYEEGKYHVPEMRLKEYFSYARTCTDSIDAVPETLTALEADQRRLPTVLTALAYAGDASGPSNPAAPCTFVARMRAATCCSTTPSPPERFFRRMAKRLSTPSTSRAIPSSGPSRKPTFEARARTPLAIAAEPSSILALPTKATRTCWSREFSTISRIPKQPGASRCTMAATRSVWAASSRFGVRRCAGSSQ